MKQQQEVKPNLVLYHAHCADGFGAAFAAYTKLGDTADYEPIMYGDQATQFDHKQCTHRNVYIVDFSFPKNVMDNIIDVATRVVWLDHHKTAFEMWEVASPFTIDDEGCYIILDNERSGAAIAWDYFQEGKLRPTLIRHIDDYDRWQFKLPKTKEFNKALWSMVPWTFEQWQGFISPYFNNVQMYNIGEAILTAHNGNVAAVVKGAQRPCIIINLIEPPKGGYSYSGLSANCPPHLTSDVGHELANQSGTFGLCWFLNKDFKCLCSLRSNGDYDVSVIAKAFGGGGHKNAAGFEVPIQTLLEWIK